MSKILQYFACLLVLSCCSLQSHASQTSNSYKMLESRYYQRLYDCLKQVSNCIHLIDAISQCKTIAFINFESYIACSHFDICSIGYGIRKLGDKEQKDCKQKNTK